MAQRTLIKAQLTAVNVNSRMPMKTTTTKQMVALTAVALATAITSAKADEVTRPAGPERTYNGRIMSVDAQNRTVTVKSWMLSKKEFNLGDNCAYEMVDNRNGTVTDLRPGEKVIVRYQIANGVRIIDRVSQEPVRFTGTVAEIDPTNHTLMLHKPGLDKPMELSGNCRVILKNERTGEISNIRPGDHVTVTYETPDGVPTAREIAQTSAEFTGKLTAIDLSDQTVKASDTFSTKKFNLANNCSILVNGHNDGKLSELEPNQRLVFSYDTVNGVNVVNRIAPAVENETNSMYTTTPGYNDYPGGY